MLLGGKANLYGIEFVKARCDCFLVIRAFWLPTSLSVPYSILFRKGGGGTFGWVGRRERGEEVGVGSVFESEAYAVKLCTIPCGAGCVKREIIFPVERHFPHVNFQSFTCSLELCLLLFTLPNSLSFTYVLLYFHICLVTFLDNFIFWILYLFWLFSIFGGWISCGISKKQT